MAVEPRNAAACILIRPGPAPQVLLARRNTSLRFMGGHHVFPGGRIDDDEPTRHVTGAIDEFHARNVHAVAREVFEETGILCARGTIPDEASLRPLRMSLLADELAFDEILDRFDLSIDAGEFAFAGKWVTPSFSKIRFATQYFLYQLSDGQREDLIEGEIVGLDWFTAEEARRMWHRGEIRVPSPVAFSLRQLAAVPLAEAKRRLARDNQRAPGDHNRFEIRRGITIVPLQSRTLPPATHTNCVIVGETALYVIDPGTDEEVEREHLKRQLDDMIELGAHVEAVLLTHSHYDHTDAVDFLRTAYQVPVLAHEAAAEQVPFAIDRHLADGEVLASGDEPQWRLRAIHTPGHDPGHLCFLEESTGTLIAGDMIANPGTIIISTDYGGSMADFMASLERLIAVDCKLIVPSHGQPEAKPRERLQRDLDHRRWRENKIKEAYESGATTLDELLAKSYDDAPPAALPLAVHSLKAHLDKLGISVKS